MNDLEDLREIAAAGKAASNAETPPDRAKDGRFLPGHTVRSSGRPGGVKRQGSEAEYLRAMREVITPERWGAVIAEIAARALNGDVAAFSALAKHAMPAEAARARLDEQAEAAELRVAGRSRLQLLLDFHEKIKGQIQMLREEEAHRKTYQGDVEDDDASG